MASYYISTTGNDTTGDGSLANPWATITKGYNSAANGDIITMIGHASNAFSGIVKSDWSKSLTVKAHPDFPLPVIDCSGGFLVQPAYGATLVWEDTIFINKVAGASFSNLFLISEYVGNGNLLELRRCVIRDITVNNTWGIFYVRYNNTIRLKNCLIHNITVTGTSSACVIQTQYEGTTEIINCILDLGANAFLTVFSGQNFSVDRWLLVNSIFYATNCASLYSLNGQGFWPPVTQITWKAGSGNNCLFGFSGWTDTMTGYFISGVADYPTDSIFDDPMFVDSATGIYELRPGSPIESKGVMT